MTRLEHDFQRLQKRLQSRESELHKLTLEKQDLAETVRKFELRKEDWKRSNKQLEDYFTEQLEKIRSNFDE